MSGEFPYAAKIVSPVKCNEKPWDLWVGEIGHSSPRPDEEPRVASKRPRYRRAGLNRLKFETMNLHGLLPQMDNLNAAVCHMCGVVVKCSAAYRHLLESHNNSEPLLPPPPPAPTVKSKTSYSRGRHKKEPIPPPPAIDLLPVKLDPPAHTSTTPVNRIVLPQPEMQYLEEPTTSTVTGEVQVSMESGELPVVSIQDTELPLGENLTDDIFAIMNSEGIQSADDITNVADWKNIIRDIGNMQEINFPSTSDVSQSQDMFPPVDASTLSAYTISDADLAGLQFAPTTSSMLPTTLEPVATVLPPKPTPPPPAVTTPAKTPSRSKAKSKFSLREYDPNKHCGVVTADNLKPCTRSLTCKAHALSLRRTVEGRAKPFDTLLAEHRAAREAPAQPPVPPPPAPAPPLLVNPLDLAAYNGIPTDQQVTDIYTLLSVEDPTAMLPDTSNLTSLLSQALPTDPAFLLPEEAEPPPEPAKHSPTIAHIKTEDMSNDVCWYSSSPRPLALCTFNASHSGGAVALGKRFATVRSNIKASLSRSQKSGGSNNFYMTANSLALSKSVHMNSSSKSNKPEVRKLIVTMGGSGASGAVLSSLLEPRLNGHVSSLAKRPLKQAKRSAPTVLDLGFSLDPLLDEKC